MTLASVAQEVSLVPGSGRGALASRESGQEDGGQFASVVDQLCLANEGLLQGRNRQSGRHVLPSRDAIAGVVADLRAVLFPAHFGSADLASNSLRYYIGARLDKAQHALTGQVRRGLSFVCDHAQIGRNAGCEPCERRALEVTEALISSLPRLRSMLDADVRAAYHGDPAARFLDETLFCYPGVTALTQHRIAHELYRQGVPLLPRIISELAHAATGIDIHPGAQIGSSFFIDHGTGVVIGETCTIGERVRIYQGVTLGARGFPNDQEGRPIKGIERHPRVEDDVIIYAGATILGCITIGRGATIGGNVWITRNVAPGDQVTQAQFRQATFENGAGI